MTTPITRRGSIGSALEESNGGRVPYAVLDCEHCDVAIEVTTDGCGHLVELEAAGRRRGRLHHCLAADVERIARRRRRLGQLEREQAALAREIGRKVREGRARVHTEKATRDEEE